MLKLIWSEIYSVGVPELDNQHKKIFTLLNTLIDIGEDSLSSEEISEALNEMTQYAYIHFDSEEKYMATIGFPDLKSHELEHHEFTEKTTEFCLDVMAGSEETTRKIINYLSHWWVNHILKMDMAFKRFAEGNR